MDLRECCAACPLYLTGYTCSLGIENQNLKLSRHRAETVAALLRKNGYKVASVEGKGMIYGSNPEKNRRVEIRLTKKQPIGPNFNDYLSQRPYGHSDETFQLLSE
jgi:hypothetical protein